MEDTDVLIVGAGPTGLVLALYLTKLGVRVRIIDKTQGPGTTSRAVVLHARNLEFYRQLGIADAVIEAGRRFSVANLWVNARQVGQIYFDDLNSGLSRFPYALIYPQDEHERLLIEQLARLGIHVERKTELVSFDASADRIRARLKKSDGSVYDCEARFLAGCDGAHSTVRQQLGIEFPGGTYAHVFYVADIAGQGPTANGQVHIALDDADFVVTFPMKQPGVVRLIGTLKREVENHAELRWEDVSQRAIEQLNLKVDKIHWFSTYRVHHRVASQFRRGNVFLLGDAAHIHSPVGGQGMNTGIGDAINLAWKLACVIQDRIDPAVLETYEPERIAFAQKLVKTTDRVFEFITATGSLAKKVRLKLVPFIFPKLFAFRAARRLVFKTLSQIAINYRHSRLSAGIAGGVRAGDRLPWVQLNAGQQTDNYACLDMLDWRVHWYGDVPPAIAAVCQARGLKLDAFAWQPTMSRAGLKKNAVYLIRPDGYVGSAQPFGDAKALEQYLGRHKIRPNADVTDVSIVHPK